jgi:hypothetical protein
MIRAHAAAVQSTKNVMAVKGAPEPLIEGSSGLHITWAAFCAVFDGPTKVHSLEIRFGMFASSVDR